MRLPFIVRLFLKMDRFLLFLILTIILATILPVRGKYADVAQVMTDIAIALLFFLHGAKLSREAIIGGLTAWRIHIMVLVATFAMFPLLGLVVRAASDLWLDPMIGSGLLLLCLMPSTVQSSIALTAMAGGNVPAAVCSASLSTILGVVFTPLLASLFLSSGSDTSLASNIPSIMGQLLVPFLIGHFARPLLRAFLEKHRSLVGGVDRSVILMVVYAAFSSAIVEGLWQTYALSDLIWTSIFASLLLWAALILTTAASRMMHLSRQDEIVVVFCGSKKSLASGIPIASALFPTAILGPLVLPLMLFHQIQLMACTVLAQRYRDRIASPQQSLVSTDMR